MGRQGAASSREWASGPDVWFGFLQLTPCLSSARPSCRPKLPKAANESLNTRTLSHSQGILTHIGIALVYRGRTNNSVRNPGSPDKSHEVHICSYA